MPLVVGGAPVVNTLFSAFLNRAFDQLKAPFLAGLLLVILGAVLISQIARGYVGSVAALVLVAFTSLILVRLTQGERPPCACFGGWSATPLGAWHVVRNCALIVLAMVAALA
jgi:hypothetical protein